jgi:hypothetical protein
MHRTTSLLGLALVACSSSSDVAPDAGPVAGCTASLDEATSFGCTLTTIYDPSNDIAALTISGLSREPEISLVLRVQGPPHAGTYEQAELLAASALFVPVLAEPGFIAIRGGDEPDRGDFEALRVQASLAGPVAPYYDVHGSTRVTIPSVVDAGAVVMTFRF